ncbi:MAG: hypothetical protein AUG85_00390 [Gemmatimonadetes bacterium 13_1_20CM_4_66_11]|nr:MAG: hypothetical protein AUG85_00390 [Gemmatimonadetes bacterium 13_1_20CM_4_66_11]
MSPARNAGLLRERDGREGPVDTTRTAWKLFSERAMTLAPTLPLVLLVAAAGLCAYTFLGYPAILELLRVVRRALPHRPQRLAAEWPTISVVLPVYNEVEGIASTLERILAIEYPAERRQILVVSDASTDGTDEIVTRFAPRGVELVRLPQRRGKTAAENATRSRLSGEIIVNTDASVQIDAGAVKHLVAAFDDPSVGVASGRDVSVSNVDDRLNPGEQAYVGYELWVRDLETSLSGIVGASGCLYAIRRDLHMHTMPDGLSRDFGAALVAREHGYRAVSVPAAICYVPRSSSLRREYRRKVRTGALAWLAPERWWAAATLALGGAVALVTAIGWVWPEGRPVPRLIAVPAYAVSGNIAALQAWIRALGAQGTALWEPTRRGVTSRS